MNLNTDMTVNRITDEIWEIPVSEKPGMLVPARIYATQGDSSGHGLRGLRSSHQCGVSARHQPVCALYAGWTLGLWISDRRGRGIRCAATGVISPGGVGYDINCGMRLIRTDLTLADVQPHLERLMTELFRKVPAGVGASGFVRLSKKEFGRVMTHGAKWCVEHGYGWHRDLARMEEGGCIEGADPSTVTDHAIHTRHESAGDLGIRQSLSRSPGGFERADIRSGHGCGVRDHRPRADRRDGALRLTRVRPSGGERLSQSV